MEAQYRVLLILTYMLQLASSLARVTLLLRLICLIYVASLFVAGIMEKAQIAGVVLVLLKQTRKNLRLTRSLQQRL